MKPRIAVTLGDPRGIGPEIVAKVLADPPADAEYLVVGPDELVSGYAHPEGVGPLGSSPLTPELAGRLTGRAIERAARLAVAGEVDAIVTAPAEKRALHLAGFPYPGHTEWLAELAGGVDVAMMLEGGGLRVVLVTTHLPLREVFDALTAERVIRTGEITARALREWFGIAEPRLALCGLNPHAGEGGLFGDEESTILAPAAEVLGAAGPLPADTVFVRAVRGEFDAVLAPYHDVGMTAVKMAAFGEGVNVTLGLPFVRTSPDHGTAMDIAGRDIADPGSMRRAVELAATLGARAAAGKT